MVESLVVIGNGMAGMACVEALLAKARGRYQVTVIGAETRPNYNRIRLSEVLAGKATPEDIVLNPVEWYAANDVTLIVGDAATSIDRDAKRVVTASGRAVSFDRLVLATGSTPFVPPLAGRDRAGVFVYRTLDDAAQIRARARAAERAMVIGGGLLGLEAARALASLGLEVTVAHLAGHLMEMQCDAEAAEIVRRELTRMGIHVLLDHAATEILGNGAVEGVRFANGNAHESDLVVVSAGIRPNVELARSAGLAVKRGVIVSEWMETSDPAILAVGECIEFRGQTFGLVAPVVEQARSAAATLIGDRSRPFVGSVTATTLKVAGIDLVSMGNFMAAVGAETIVYADPSAALYQKVVIQGGRVVGAILLGDLRPKDKLFGLLKSGEDVALMRRSLLAGDAGQPITVADLPDDATICGCLGVTKGTIVEAIQVQGCASRAAVAEKTRACTSCKSCAPLVDQLLQDSLGGAYVKVERPKVFCVCVPLAKRALRAEIRARNLRSVTAVLDALGNGVGCPSCRPALAYVVSEVWCNDHIEERRHRFINDRVHANIQKDGTFSVVPRMYGGVTTASELKKIATVAEKYRVPLIKLTGGARVDFLGVEKADLPRIWADLGMPSGHAYAKAIRTCKACVGQDFCRFGVADSIGTAIEMEKAFEGVATPHKVKMGVSGCPRNCAEATVKDIGLVGVQGGWQVHTGGAAGMVVRKADLLVTVETREEALDAATRYLQHYREEAEVGERTHAFNERVGIDAIRAAVLDGDVGPVLVARFRETKARVTDPWLERETPVHPRQFGLLATRRAAGGTDG